MKKAAACMVGATVFVLALTGTAFAGYTDSPSPTTVVEGSGGSAGAAGAGDTAFTGGSVSVALVVALATVSVGVIALVMARRRAATS